MTTARIIDLFHLLDQTIDVPLTMLIIGGGAMALRGEKEATKDIDVVVPEKHQYSMLLEALTSARFRRPAEIDTPYQNMQTNIFIHDDGYWVDTFQDSICNRFVIHDGIFDRAEVHTRLNNLTVFLMSREDIFLSKSVTEREGDLDDMYALYVRGLDEELLIAEVGYQTERSVNGLIWEAFLTSKLDELEEKFRITVPFKRTVERRANRLIEEMLTTEREQLSKMLISLLGPRNLDQRRFGPNIGLKHHK